MPPEYDDDEEMSLGDLLGDGAGEKPKPKRDMAEPDGDEELPPGFAEAVEEFDAATDPNERAHALKRAIRLCYEAQE